VRSIIEEDLAQTIHTLTYSEEERHVHKGMDALVAQQVCIGRQQKQGRSTNVWPNTLAASGDRLLCLYECWGTRVS